MTGGSPGEENPRSEPALSYDTFRILRDLTDVESWELSPGHETDDALRLTTEQEMERLRMSVAFTSHVSGSFELVESRNPGSTV